jgi:hypothetical protein
MQNIFEKCQVSFEGILVLWIFLLVVNMELSALHMLGV